ncbi:enoyl-[acyl-carrier-protein] reductase FabV [Suicoccus acidiformans]|uniref:trans-2-enoyl-CoA reductase (NAD(+)) n=1 Tax=Suicoccus acidiformans TaxID=2036206 RepID=A0A347WJ39_9LACT|nr:enoyl-ACP reductase FabV [Suicoccus acidiformans]AXY25096.1 enoyl-[acyl-carrier-protein] reductase FabV [Suicoccus acidiformans]
MALDIQPKMRGNVLMGINPMGLKQEIQNQINYVKSQGTYEAPKRVLILGASSSYGLATRITLAFGGGADTIGVSYENGPRTERNLGTPGWYNNIFFKEAAEAEGLVAKNFVGDAFSDEMKANVIEYIQEEFGGKVDLVVYSLATGRRTDPETGETYRSSIKAIGQTVEGPDINLEKEEFYAGHLEAASEEEIEATVKVMGGEDWYIWMQALHEAGVLAEGAKTFCYSYLGDNLNRSYYQDGTLGRAKADCDAKAEMIADILADINGEARVIVATAVTTKASAVIPFFPVYCLGLYKVMEEEGTHETPIMHQDRIYRTMVYGDAPEYDEVGRLRPDSWELRPETQAKAEELIRQIDAENFNTDFTAWDTFMHEFLNLNGFDVDHYEHEEVTLEDLQALEP